MHHSHKAHFQKRWISLFVHALFWLTVSPVSLTLFPRSLAISAISPFPSAINCATAKCGDELDEVCGTDGKTYQNYCMLRCVYNQQLFSVGACPSNHCNCPFNLEPVCGLNNQSYGNICFLNCAGFALGYKGVCVKGCVCTLFYSPVCGSDLVSYANECLLNCVGVTKKSNGICPANCGCSGQAYAPVCGINWLTYDNACALRCAGIDKL